MRIDLFTFVAQIVNFLILIGLLRHYLYRPLLDVMDRREERISARLEEARATREEADRALDALESERADLAGSKRRMLDEAREEVKGRKRELLDRAREDVDRLERAWRESIRRERSAFLEDLSERVESQILATARRVLRDLADESLEDRVVETFLHRFDALEPAERAALAEAIGGGRPEPTVRTRFPLSKARRRRIGERLSAIAGEPVEPRFEEVPDVGFGIELEGGGHRIGWGLASYLGALEERVDAALEESLRSRVGAADEGAGPDAAETGFEPGAAVPAGSGER